MSEGRSPGIVVPLVMLLAAGLAWGAIFTVNRIATEAGVPPVVYAFWSILLAGLTMAVVSLAVEGLPRLGPRFLLFYFVSGVANFGFAIILFAYVAAELPAGVVTLVMMMTPTMTYAFAFALRIERFRVASFLGLLFGIGGVLMIVLPDFSLPSRDMVVWFLLALLGPTSFAAGNVYVAMYRPPEAPGLMLTAGLCLGACVFILPALVIAGGDLDPLALRAEGLAAMGLAALIYIVTLSLFFEIIRRVGPLFWSQIGYVAVASGIAWGAAVFGERLSVGIWLGAGLMGVGLALVNRGVRDAARETAGRVGAD